MIFTLDFEASCLPRHGRSFPIEVGISDTGGRVQSWLIRPEPEWRDWTWTAEAEALHGLSRDRLARDGLPPAEVVAALTAALGGQPAYADSYLDADWMRTLEAAAGAPAAVAVRHIDALVDQLGLGDAAVARAVEAANAQSGARHRAGDDARWLSGLVVALQAEAAGALRQAA